MPADLDFLLCPAFDVVEHEQRRSTRTPPGSTVTQARQINERSHRAWSLAFPDLNRANRDTLRRLWREARGPVLPMNYTPRGRTPTQVTFNQPRLVILHRKGKSSASVELLEVR